MGIVLVLVGTDKLLPLLVCLCLFIRKMAHSNLHRVFGLIVYVRKVPCLSVFSVMFRLVSADQTLQLRVLVEMCRLERLEIFRRVAPINVVVSLE